VAESRKHLVGPDRRIAAINQTGCTQLITRLTFSDKPDVNFKTVNRFDSSPNVEFVSRRLLSPEFDLCDRMRSMSTFDRSRSINRRCSRCDSMEDSRSLMPCGRNVTVVIG
jgi:hypothetical protein